MAQEAERDELTYTSNKSAVFTFQIRTLDKTRLFDYRGQLSAAQMKLVDQGLALSFGLVSFYR